MMYPEPEKGGRGNKLSRNQDSLAPSNKTEKNNAVLARFILKHAPETAKLVRDGHPNCGGWRTPRDYFPVVALTVQLVSPNLVAGERPVIIFSWRS